MVLFSLCCGQVFCVCLHGFVHWFLTGLEHWLEHHDEVLQFICELHSPAVGEDWGVVGFKLANCKLVELFS